MTGMFIVQIGIQLPAEKRLSVRLSQRGKFQKLFSLLVEENSLRIHRPFFKVCVCLFSLKIANGEPTVTVRPNVAQKFQRNKQAGGGTYIPVTIKLEGPREYEEAVLDRVRTTLAECENERVYVSRYRKLERRMIHDEQIQT